MSHASLRRARTAQRMPCLRDLLLAFVPLLSHHLWLFEQLTPRTDQLYLAEYHGITLQYMSDRSLSAPRVEKVDIIQSNSACATISPGRNSPISKLTLVLRLWQTSYEVLYKGGMF